MACQILIRQRGLSQQPRDPFRLFDLPRELRDIIYLEMLEKDFRADLSCGLILRATNIPNIAPLLANRQFSEEYKSCAQLNTTLTIIDTENFHFDRVDLPGPARNMPAVTINISLAAKTNVLKQHETWIAHTLPRLPNLHSLNFRVNYHEDDPAVLSDTRFWYNETSWSRIPVLKGMECYMCKPWSVFEFEEGGKDQSELIMQWSRQTGRVEDVRKRGEKQPMHEKDRELVEWLSGRG